MDQEKVLISSSAFIHSSAVIEQAVSIGEHTQIWLFTHIENAAVVGDNCIVGQNVYIGRSVRIGNGVKIQNNVSVYEGVTCEDDVFLGPSAVFTNIINPRSAVTRKHKLVTTLIKKGASIGANATIICGNNIGKYAFVGAGSVVTKEVPDYALFVGNPATHKGWVSEFGHQLKFDKSGFASCIESGQKYKLEEGTVVRVS